MNAVYPGSFDPITNGHLDIIERASKIFDQLTVAILVNQSKKPMFTSEERIDMIKNSVSHLPNVNIDSFQGLLVNYIRDNDIEVIVRGLRAMSDFENEFQMALTNKKLYDAVETVFLVTKLENSYLSSSVVKEVAVFNGDFSDLVPNYAYDKIIKKLGE